MEPTTKKMNAFETFIAIIKGYCTIMVLLLPRAFGRGGYVLSPIIMILAGALQMFCALKLVAAGKRLGLSSYSLIAFKALGHTGKVVLDIMIALTQFSFSLSLCAFITESFHTLLDVKFGL